MMQGITRFWLIGDIKIPNKFTNFLKIITSFIFCMYLGLTAHAFDKYSFVTGTVESHSEIELNPENASQYGVRIYMYGDSYRTDFKVKIANNWNDSKYVGHSIYVGIEDSYFGYSGFGCKADNSGVFFSVRVLNSKLDSTVLDLDYLMNKKDRRNGKITTLSINLKEFLTYKDKEPDLYSEHWKYGVGPLDKHLEKRIAFKSGIECRQFFLFSNP